jgi:ribbon-helix-helix CopG family protein
MKRISVYLDEGDWKILRARARRGGISVSRLVREAIAEKYERIQMARREAMLGIVGIRKDRKDIGDSTNYIRRLRKGRSRM